MISDVYGKSKQVLDHIMYSVPPKTISICSVREEERGRDWVSTKLLLQLMRKS